jgi:hypothetical protein
VGPRSFRYGETLYARDQEIGELLDLLIAERIVLLHSPSGAGKTSLIQAALIPRLEQEGFVVLPVVRVARTPPPGVPVPPNRHVLSALISFETSREEALGLPLEALARLSLADYLDRWVQGHPAAGSLVLVFDQFEEILSASSTDDEKRAFFTEVGAALHDKDRWALFSMREEYVGALEPFVRPLPTRLKSRYRLPLLREPAARRAMQLPARAAGVDFADEAAVALTTDLRRTTVQRPDGSSETVPGEFIEPVQLQVVCHRLWSRLPPDRTRIDVDDVRGLHDVDRALADYYADSVRDAAAGTAVSERAIRDWFEQQLFTSDGIRRLVLLERGAGQTIAEAIGPLVNAHLLRREQRSGATYVELSHDRLVEPIQTDNARWRDAHLTLLQRQAALWQQEGRPDGLLLSGTALVEAESWSTTAAADLNAVERAFLVASRKEHSNARTRKRLNIVTHVLSLTLLLLLLGIAYYAYDLFADARPWAHLHNLASGAVYELQGDVVSVGRSTEEVRNQVNLVYRVVSRIHLSIFRGGVAVDMRSLNGTVINGEFLPYSKSWRLDDGDLIVLADIVPFEYRRVADRLLPLRPAVERRTVPAGAWAILMDWNDRRRHYLVRPVAVIGVGPDNRLVIGDGSGPDPTPLLIVRRDEGAWAFDTPDRRTGEASAFTVEDLDDGVDLWAEMKMGDYTYRACRVPPGRAWTRLVPRTMQCRDLEARPDMPEEKLQAYAPFMANLVYPDRKLRLRIVPLVPGLDGQPGR